MPTASPISCSRVRDPFWETHATLTGAPMASPARLIGEERVHDMLANIFWPMVLLDDEAAAQRGLENLPAAANNAARIASQRMLVSALTPQQQREALIQQGLLQVFRDYCSGRLFAVSRLHVSGAGREVVLRTAIN